MSLAAKLVTAPSQILPTAVVELQNSNSAGSVTVTEAVPLAANIGGPFSAVGASDSVVLNREVKQATVGLRAHGHLRRPDVVGRVDERLRQRRNIRPLPRIRASGGRH
jgi:hypothetical protein